MVLFIWITIVTAIALLSIASIEDLKTREVPDYLSYFLIGIAVFIRILWFFFEKDTSIIFWVPIALGVLGGFSYLMYKGGQWGGGDVKIMIGVAILLSSFQGEILPFFINFLFNSLIVGAFYGVFAMGLISLKNIKKMKFKWYEIIVLPVAITIKILLFWFFAPVIAFLGAFLVISFTSMFYFKKIEKVGMQAYVPVEKLTEGDWLVNDIKLNGKVFLKKTNIGLTLSDLRKLKKMKNQIKKVKIKVGIPFVPVFLISAIVTMIFGNLLISILMLS